MKVLFSPVTSFASRLLLSCVTQKLNHFLNFKLLLLALSFRINDIYGSLITTTPQNTITVHFSSDLNWIVSLHWWSVFINACFFSSFSGVTRHCSALQSSGKKQHVPMPQINHPIAPVETFILSLAATVPRRNFLKVWSVFTCFRSPCITCSSSLAF